MRTTTASGLIQNWKQHTKHNPRSASHEPPTIGGLKDSDAIAQRPNFVSSKHFPQKLNFDGTQDASCKNHIHASQFFATHTFNMLLDQVVSAINSDIESNEPAPLPTGRKPKPKAMTRMPTHRPDVNTNQDKPAYTARPLTANTVWTSHLPAFTQVDLKWRTIHTFPIQYSLSLQGAI